jgi:DNA adenine methylase
MHPPTTPESDAPAMKIVALAPWFGGNRQNAERVGREFAGVAHITIPFMGGGSEIAAMPPKAQLYVCDKHDDIIRLARVVANDGLRARLVAILDARLFHPRELEEAQARLRAARVRGLEGGLFADDGSGEGCGDVERAADYFTAAWMGRNGTAGSRSEADSGLALRSCGHGGDPTTRYRSACESLEAWGAQFRRCSFARESCWETLPRVRNRALALIKQNKPPKLGVYADPPWVDEGDAYIHPFTTEDHRRLAAELRRMPEGVRVVVRYGDHPLVRDLYEGWTFVGRETRNQRNGKVTEVLIINGPSLTEGWES